MKKYIITIFLSLAIVISLIIPSRVVMAKEGGNEESYQSIYEKNDAYDEIENEGQDKEEKKEEIQNQDIEEGEQENIAPKIIAEDKTINIGEEFDPKTDVTATDKDGNDITKNIEILENTVDINTIGKYIVTYSVKDSSNLESRKTIYVTVKKDAETINSSPIIDTDNKSIYVGDKFNPWDGVTAMDEEDGDITDSIKILANTVDVNKAGIYIVTYEVIDKDGASTRKTIEVSVVNKDEKPKKNEVPIINASDRIIKYGSNFDPLYGVTAYDKEDGNITSKIIVEQNLVDPYTRGKYSVTYSVTDSNGEKITKVINVEVEEKKEQINNAPIIYASNVTIKLANKFNPYAMVSAYDKEDGWISDKIIVEYNYVNIYKAGKYDVGYSVTDSSGMKASCVITITVKDTANTDKKVEDNSEPTIYANNISIPLNSKFNPLEWVVAIDKEDGDITNRVMVISNEVDTSKEGNYHVTYEVIDKSGSKANKVIMVYVKKEEEIKRGNKPPVIYAEDIILEKGSYYDPLDKVTALDDEDGNLSHKIVVKSNNVNVSKSGKYKVTLEVTDSMGEVATKTINVIVKGALGLNDSFKLILICIGIVGVILIISSIVAVGITRKKR